MSLKRSARRFLFDFEQNINRRHIMICRYNKLKTIILLNGEMAEMDENMNLSKGQMEMLFKRAAETTGESEEKIRDSVNSGNLSSLLGKLKPGQAEMLTKVLSDKNAAEQLLSTPQARALLKKLLDK